MPVTTIEDSRSISFFELLNRLSESREANVGDLSKGILAAERLYFMNDAKAALAMLKAGYKQSARFKQIRRKYETALGIVRAEFGQLNASFACFGAAMNLANEIGDIAGARKTLVSASGISILAGQYKRSYSYLTQLSQITNRHEKSAYAGFLVNQASLFSIVGDPRVGLQSVAEARSITDDFTDAYHDAKVISGLVEVRLRLATRDYDRAYEVAERAWRASSDCDGLPRINTAISFGWANIALGNHDEGYALLSQSLNRSSVGSLRRVTTLESHIFAHSLARRHKRELSQIRSLTRSLKSKRFVSSALDGAQASPADVPDLLTDLEIRTKRALLNSTSNNLAGRRFINHAMP